MNLAKALSIATTAHQNQFDNSGLPYALHTLKVMFILIEQGIKDEHTLILAVLHDLLEDHKYTKYNADMLRADGFSEEIVSDLIMLTRSKHEDYEVDYIPRVGSSYRTALVKRADLIHNSDIFRLKGVSEKDMKRMAKYHRSFVYLQAKIKEFESCINGGGR
mgnify:CR=1 FL=1